MTDAPAAQSPDDVLQSEYAIPWEVPETAAVAVLVATGVLIVGGFVAGVVASTASYGASPPAGAVVGSAISFGTTWAGPLLAIALLGVVGLSWWQADAWGDELDPDDDGGRVVEVAGHVRRANRISQWAQAELVVVCVGAAALVVGTIMATSGDSPITDRVDWSRIIVAAVNLVAVIVLTGAGVWVGRKSDVDQERSD